MTLRREEAQTGKRYAQMIAFGVSVVVCDHPGCRGGYLVGIGEGDDLPPESIADAESDGWSIGDRDYCPAHAAEHSDGSDGEDAADEDDE